MSAQIKFKPSWTQLRQIQDVTGSYWGMDLFESTRGCALNCVHCNIPKSITDLNKIEFIPLNDLIVSLNSTLTVSSDQNLRLGTDGDALLHPDIGSLIHHIRTHFPLIKIQIFTSGVKIEKKTESYLNDVTSIIAPLDIGTEESFKKIARPVGRATLKHQIKNLSQYTNVTLLTHVFQNEKFNFESEIEEWMEVVSLIQPQTVILTTVEKSNFASGIFPVDEMKLHHIAQLMNAKKKIKVTVG